MDALNYNPYPLIYPLPEKHKPFEQKIPAYNRDYPTPAKGVLTGGAKIKGAVSRNSAKLGNYKMPVKLRET